MEKKIALVTGANKGIGLEAARQLGQQGYSVWLGCRDAERGEAAAAALRDQGLDAHAVVLDVTDAGTVRNAAALLKEKAGRLDALVNNAGISLGYRARPSEETIEDVKAIYDVNVFGPVMVTQAMLPLLRRSAAPRVVMVSSGLGSLAAAADRANPGYAFNFLGYRSSKTALNAATIALAKDLEADGIRVNAADPEFTATDLNGNTGFKTPEQGARIIVQLATMGDDAPTGTFLGDHGPVAW